MADTDTRVDRPYRRLSPLTPLVRSFIFVVAVVSASWRDALSGHLGPLGWILLALLLAGAVFGTASWLRTKYWIEGDELRVDTGVISQQSRRIRVDRLQGVDIVQPLVARLFGLAELKMDVAGGHRREGSLAFLPLAEAQELKEVLLARRDAVRREQDLPADRPGPRAAPAAAAPPVPDRVLLRVDHAVLAVSLLISGETFGFLVSAAVFAVLFAFAGGFAAGSSVVPIVIGFGLFQARKFTGFYNLTVSQTQSGLQVRRGMFELTSQTIALPRVQGIVIVEPLLWRLMGWARLDVSIAGYGRAEQGDKPAASTILPVGPREQAVWLASYVLQGLQPSQVALSPPPARARWVAPVRRLFMSAGIGDTLISSRSGMLTRRTHVVPHERVQSLRLSQGPWQRRLGLADVHVDSPPGPVRVRARHRDAAEARLLLNREGERAALARRPLR
jgi:putative membrane protein